MEGSTSMLRIQGKTSVEGIEGTTCTEGSVGVTSTEGSERMGLQVKRRIPDTYLEANHS